MTIILKKISLLTGMMGNDRDGSHLLTRLLLAAKGK